jgi:excinuclease ABC subunit A
MEWRGAASSILPICPQIEIRGARTHNLRNLDVDIPRGKLVVVTGVSGSGKSSLAIDTLFAEGQRQFLESLSSYARQFVDQLERSDVDCIRGLQPSICIDQQQGSLSPRSTVGTVTEVYDYLRLLMARVATPACYQCGAAIERQSPTDIHNAIMTLGQELRLTLLAPMVIGRKGAHAEVFDRMSQAGIVRAWIDGETYEMDSLPKLSVRKEHTISAVVDRFILRPDNFNRLGESIQAALKLSSGLIEIRAMNREGGDEIERFYSTRYACIRCGINLREIEPRTFSFNSPYGACPTCEGFGAIGEDQVLCRDCKGGRLRRESLAIKLENHSIADIGHMSLDACRQFLHSLKMDGNRQVIAAPIVREIDSRLEYLCDVGLGYLTLFRNAETLSGGELQRVKLASCIGSGLTGVCYVLDEPSVGLHPKDTEKLIDSLLHLTQQGNTIVVVEHDAEIMKAADWIIDCGPGAGRLGGTIVANGDARSFFDKRALQYYPKSETAKYLHLVGGLQTRSRLPVEDGTQRLQLLEINRHNLTRLSVDIPLHRLVAVTGVSGSGKSTLVQETLAPAVDACIKRLPKSIPSHLLGIRGHESIDKMIVIDQSPIGRSPRSNPATYCGFWDDVRKIFASTRDAKQRGLNASFFSFNSGAGRCEACGGQGTRKIEMNFLSDVYIRCAECRGTRFQRSLLSVHFKDKSIAQVLEMSIDEAADFFSEIPNLSRPLACLQKVGLGYMPLGQSANTLSGGEAQRIKLASELSKKGTGNTLYLLDEPTTGLHGVDVQKLIEVFSELVHKGNSVLVVEHQLDVIWASDWVIDMGPGAGEQGGQIVAQGIPPTIAKLATPTGVALAKAFH